MAEWTPERQRAVFSEAYLNARSVFPGMGGRFVDQFHAVVVATAKAQREDPEALFRKHLATWLAKMPSKAKTAPYAFFATAWCELADKGPVTVEEAPKRRVAPEERYADLKAALSRLEGDLTHAKVFGTPQQEREIAERMSEIRAQMRTVREAG